MDNKCYSRLEEETTTIWVAKERCRIKELSSEFIFEEQVDVQRKKK